MEVELGKDSRCRGTGQVHGPQVDLIMLCVCVCVQAEGQEVASVVSTRELNVVAELLQVSPDALLKSVTFKLTVSGNKMT